MVARECLLPGAGTSDFHFQDLQVSLVDLAVELAAGKAARVVGAAAELVPETKVKASSSGWWDAANCEYTRHHAGAQVFRRRAKWLHRQTCESRGALDCFTA